MSWQRLNLSSGEHGADLCKTSRQFSFIFSMRFRPRVS